MHCCSGGIVGSGDASWKVMLVGIEPALNEMQTGKPFQGNSGHLLDATLVGCGWHRDKTFATNLCCKWHNPPLRADLDQCRPRLLREIAEHRPNLIVALGALACEELFHMKLSKCRGAILRDVLGQQGMYGMATYHPSYILQSSDNPEEQNNAAAELVRDLRKIKLFFSDPSNVKVPSLVTKAPMILGTREVAQDFLNKLSPNTELVVIDIETPIDKDEKAGDAYGAIKCVGVCIGDDVQYVITAVALKGLRWPRYLNYAGWNLYGFDAVAMRAKLGVKIPIVHDGMLVSYVKDERTKYGTHKLKNNAREWCLDPSTRILKAELLWTPIGELEIGDELIGFEEYPTGMRRKLESSFVTEKKIVTLPRYKITTNYGTVIASAQHKWLAVSPKGSWRQNTQKYTWQSTHELQIGDKIQHFCTPWEVDESNGAGYLAGFFDADGCASTHARTREISFGQLDGIAATRVLSLAGERGFKFSKAIDSPHRRADFGSYRLVGTDRPYLRFLGSIRPARLLYNSRKMWRGGSASGTMSFPAIIECIEKIEDGEVVSLTTTTKTFIAEGLLSHNCGANFWEEGDPLKGDDLPKLYKYNGLDTAYTHRDISYRLKTFDEDDKKLYYDLLIPAANMYSEAQYEGVSIDEWKVLELALKLASEIEDTEEALRADARNYGWPSSSQLNLDSPQQVNKLLFGYMGIDPSEVSHLTKGGKWSTDKNVLDAINNEWAAKFRRRNNLTETKVRYVDGVLKQIKFDRKVHPKCWIPGTTTGRPSYSDPPVQQLPHARTVGELSEVRAIFVADDDKHVLLEADYQQGELWMMYGFSGDQHLYEDLTEPWSVTGLPNYHSRTCSLRSYKPGVACLEHIDHKDPSCPICVQWAFDRDGQKHVNFGIPYGESAVGLMRPPPIGTGLPQRECQALVDAWYQRNTDFQAWQRAIEHTLVTTGFIKTPSGRKRRFPIVLNKRQIRQAINAPIQGTLSDYTLKSAIIISRELRKLDSRFLWSTHDSLLLHVAIRYLDEVRWLVSTYMPMVHFDGFPSIPIDIATGHNLYEVSP